MENVVQQPAREIPVLADYDVIVCGGGPAGCAAAIGAARHGARTLLIEKDWFDIRYGCLVAADAD